MHVRVLLAPWHDVQTDSARLLAAVSLVQKHFGNVPWFIGGREAINTYMEEEPSLLMETPPTDIGLGILLSIPDPPNLNLHVSLDRRSTSPPWPGPPHDEAAAARLQIRACSTLKQTPPPEVVALVKAHDDAHLAWNAALREQEAQIPVVAAAIEEHIQEHVARALHPIRQQLAELLETRDVKAHIEDYHPEATRTLRALGWMPVPESNPKK